MKQLTIMLLLVVLAGCFSIPPVKTGLEGKTMPSFNLLFPDSSTYFNTESIPTGKPVILLYFGVHCPYSRAQMGEIIKHIDILNDIRFYIFTASSFADMKSFYDYYDLKKYPNIVTGFDYDYFFENYYKTTGVPYMAIYGKDKKLHKAFLGNIPSKQIKHSIEY